MSLPDSDEVASLLLLVAQPEAVAAAALALVAGKTNPMTGASPLLTARVGGKGVAKVGCSLLEYLCGDRVPPSKSGHLLGDSAVSGDDEYPAGFFALLPCVEGVDEVVAGPGDLH
jgi:hypothetical protein